MIKLFRQIRQNLLMENKTGKYFKYAIGEIILVVIGILIALQINNTNNLKQERKIEQEYLQSLQAEFELNLENLETLIALNKEMTEDVEKLLTLFDKSILDTINDTLTAVILNDVMDNYDIYMPSLGVLTDLISSGNLNLIQNKKLRHQLASFEISLDRIDDQEKTAEKEFHAIRDLFNEKSSLQKLFTQIGWYEKKQNSISDTMNYESLLKSVQFENSLLSFHAMNRTSNNRIFPDFKTTIENILLEIEKDLEK
ncbi:DUF6090 family protein [Geojedonia litorea]|uniref:DUF6090 family protein n=1 Tax=Geojedonia litorea TaxID=1268269 RepID=A0ABV9N0L3_9FLAO